MRQIQHNRRRYTFGQSFKGNEPGKTRKVINVQTRQPINMLQVVRNMIPWAILAGIVYYLVDTYAFT